MENENVNQISYESLRQAYDQLLQQAQELDRRYQVLMNDKTIDKIKAMCNMIEHRDVYSEKLIKLVEWHLEQIFAKPSKSK